MIENLFFPHLDLNFFFLLNLGCSEIPQRFRISSTTMVCSLLIFIALFTSIVSASLYGDNWVASNAATEVWRSCAINSGTGQYAVACANGNYIYYSSDSGHTWTQSDSISASWWSVAISSTGQYAVAGGNSG